MVARVWATTSSSSTHEDTPAGTVRSTSRDDPTGRRREGKRKCTYACTLPPHSSLYERGMGEGECGGVVGSWWEVITTSSHHDPRRRRKR